MDMNLYLLLALLVALLVVSYLLARRYRVRGQLSLIRDALTDMKAGNLNHRVLARENDLTKQICYDINEIAMSSQSRLIQQKQSEQASLTVMEMEQQAKIIVTDNGKAGISAKKQEIDRNRRFVRGLYENFVQKVLTSEEHFTIKKDYATVIATLSDEINTLENGLAVMDAPLAKYKELEQDAKVLEKNHTLTAALIDRLIERIEITHDKEIRVRFRFKSEFEEYGKAVEQCRNVVAAASIAIHTLADTVLFHCGPVDPTGVLGTPVRVEDGPPQSRIGRRRIVQRPHTQLHPHVVICGKLPAMQRSTKRGFADLS